MVKSINLLPDLSSSQRQKDAKLWYLNLVAVGFLMVTGVALVGLLAYQNILIAKGHSQTRQITSLEESINKDSELVNLVYFINSKVNKLKTATPKLDRKVDIGRVTALVPASSELLSYSQNSLGAFELSGTADRIEDVDSLVRTLEESAAPFYQKFTIDSLSTDKDGRYKFVVSFVKNT